MNRDVEVCCPYCGCKANVKVTSNYGEMALVLCDVMDGGCDSWYTVKSTVEIKTEVLKIEGEGGKKG